MTRLQHQSIPFCGVNLGQILLQKIQKGSLFMSRRGENIRKRKDGRWEARYKKGVDASGTSIYGSVYGHSYKEVKEKRQEIFQNPFPMLPQDKDVRFRDAQKLWMDQNCIRLKASTKRKYQYLLERHILPEIGEMKLSQISAPIINSYLDKKLKKGRLDGIGGLSPSYVRSITLIISAILSFAASEKMCPPLLSKINKPAISRKELPILSRSQQEILVNSISREPDETKIGVLVALYAGLRIGEICALSWDDIDLDNNIIYVRHTLSRVKSEDGAETKTVLVIEKPKTAASLRCVPICSKLQSVLKDYFQRANSRYLVSSSNDFISPRTFEYRYHAALREIGIDQINFHALRHTFATRCIEAGVDVKTLSEILGHADASITLNTYVHSSFELKRSQLEKMTV